MLEVQKNKDWPGLAKEVSDICEQVGISDINDHDIPDYQIKKAIAEHHYAKLKDDIKNSKKMEKHKDDDFRKAQPYMKGKSLEQTRMCFRARCEMVKEIKGNFKSKYTRNGGEEALVCDNEDCKVVETQSHCLTCPKWEGIREGLDLTVIQDLATFFQRLLVERGKEKLASKAAPQDSCNHDDC